MTDVGGNPRRPQNTKQVKVIKLVGQAEGHDTKSIQAPTAWLSDQHASVRIPEYRLNRKHAIGLHQSENSLPSQAGIRQGRFLGKNQSNGQATAPVPSWKGNQPGSVPLALHVVHPRRLFQAEAAAIASGHSGFRFRVFQLDS